MKYDQEQANEMALENGYDLASFLYEKDGIAVWLCEDEEETCTGLPCVIVYDGKSYETYEGEIALSYLPTSME